MRPRCCFRYLTFFGINIVDSPWRVGRVGRIRLANVPPHTPQWPSRPLRSPRGRPAWPAVSVFLIAADAWHQALALVEPHLHADLPVRRARLGEPVIDVRTQRL